MDFQAADDFPVACRALEQLLIFRWCRKENVLERFSELRGRKLDPRRHPLSGIQGIGAKIVRWSLRICESICVLFPTVAMGFQTELTKIPFRVAASEYGIGTGYALSILEKTQDEP